MCKEQQSRHSTSSRVVLFCSLHGVTTSVNYYSTRTEKCNLFVNFRTRPRKALIVNGAQGWQNLTKIIFWKKRIEKVYTFPCTMQTFKKKKHRRKRKIFLGFFTHATSYLFPIISEFPVKLATGWRLARGHEKTLRIHRNSLLKGLSIVKHNKRFPIEKRLLITKIEVKMSLD